jgi:hypothetical protein
MDPREGFEIMRAVRLKYAGWFSPKCELNRNGGIRIEAGTIAIELNPPCRSDFLVARGKEIVPVFVDGKFLFAVCAYGGWGSWIEEIK